MCVLVASTVALPAPAAAWIAFGKITNATTGALIAGGVTQKGQEGSIQVLGIGNRVQLPTDQASGLPSGKVKISPFEMVKPWDPATPKLVTAIANATPLKVEITIFKTTATGTSVPGFNITLTGAILSELDTSYDPGAESSAVEKLLFTYQKFQWTDLITGATGSVSLGP
jgi:type VI secretion system Hcp family effector